MTKISGDSSVTVWGSGNVKENFIRRGYGQSQYTVMNYPTNQIKEVTDEMLSHINIGSGIDLSIAQLASKIAEVVEFQENKF